MRSRSKAVRSKAFPRKVEPSPAVKQPQSPPAVADPLLLLSPEETADKLRISVTTLAIWRSKQRYDLKFVTIGNRIFYRQSTLEKFIASRETNETNHQDQNWRERLRERKLAAKAVTQ